MAAPLSSQLFERGLLGLDFALHSPLPIPSSPLDFHRLPLPRHHYVPTSHAAQFIG